MEKQELLEGKKILVVDDEPDILETVQELLPMCEIATSTMFSQAQDLLQTQDFDVAILDIMGVEGFKLLEIAKNRGITAVMLTAHALSPENAKKSFERGASYYIAKEKMADIKTFLEDVLEAQGKGKSTWWRWLERWAGFYDKKFGPDWKGTDKDFWEKFTYI